MIFRIGTLTWVLKEHSLLLAQAGTCSVAFFKTPFVLTTWGTFSAAFPFERKRKKEALNVWIGKVN